MYLTLRELEKKLGGFKGKVGLVRHGFDVLNDKGKVKSDKRIQDGRDTPEYLARKGAKVILIGHNGRPGGKIVPSLSHENMEEEVSAILERQVRTLSNCVGPEVEAEIERMHNGEIISLENLRFNSGEKSKVRKERTKFARQLAKLGDFYVDDAFSNAHRDHASMTGIPMFLPSCAGFLLEEELKRLSILDNPERPYVAIIGGAKLDKIGLIKQMLGKADVVILGGGLIFTFYKLQGYEIGKSLYDEENAGKAKKLLKEKKVWLPGDVMAANKLSADSRTKNVPVSEIPAGWYGVEIGEASANDIIDILSKARTVSWNGPLGMFEVKKFRKNSARVARYLASRTRRTKTIVGGGDSAKFFEVLGLDDKIYHVSTGGGSSLEYIEGKKLAAVTALEKSYKKFFRR